MFGRIRATALLLATVACLGVAPPAAAQVDFGGRLEIHGPVWGGWEDLQQNTCTQAQLATGACFVTTSGADCVTTGVNRIDCFARVPGGVVARRQWDGQNWQPWAPLSGLAMHSYSNAAPECVASAQGRIDCMARESNMVQPHPSSAVFHSPVSGTATWTAMPPEALSSDPECLSPQAGRLECFGRGTDGTLWQATFAGASWAWVRRGNPMVDQIKEITKPSCVILNMRIVCVFVSSANQLREFSVRLDGSSPSFRDVTTSASFTSNYGVVAVSPKCVVNGDIHCIMPASDGGASTLVWLSSNGTSAWSPRNAGSNSCCIWGANFGDGQTARYDWDCVVMHADRLDCMELVVQGMRARSGGEQLSRVVLRHGVLTPSAGTSTWSDAALSTAPTRFPTFLDCMSWGVDRIDCFATGSPHAATALWHAWFAPAPPRPVAINPNRTPPAFRPPSN